MKKENAKDIELIFSCRLATSILILTYGRTYAPFQLSKTRTELVAPPHKLNAFLAAAHGSMDNRSYSVDGALMSIHFVVNSTGIRVWHGWATAQGARYKGALAH